MCHAFCLTVKVISVTKKTTLHLIVQLVSVFMTPFNLSVPSFHISASYDHTNAFLCHKPLCKKNVSLCSSHVPGNMQ